MLNGGRREPEVRGVTDVQNLVGRHAGRACGGWSDDLNVQAQQASSSTASHGCRRASRSDHITQTPAKYAGRNGAALSDQRPARARA
jgi:hypothetical protein